MHSDDNELADEFEESVTISRVLFEWLKPTGCLTIMFLMALIILLIKGV